MFEQRVKNLEEMIFESDHIYERVGAKTQKWGTVEVLGIITEKIKEFLTDIPNSIKTLTPNDTQILGLKLEILNMVNAGMLELPTLEASLVLGMYAGVPCKLNLSNYEYSKKAIESLIKNHNDNAPEKIKLLKENETASEKIVKQNNQVIMEIEDCEKAMHFVSFETPFGEVKIKDGKLVDVKTNQVYLVSELDKYSFIDGKIVLNNAAQAETTNLANGKDVGGKK